MRERLADQTEVPSTLPPNGALEVGAALVLRRCQITVECSNLGAVRFAKWLDFEIEGRMRSFGRTDSYMMGKIYGRST